MIRLIDANEIREFVLRQMRNDNIYCANDFLDVIDEQPTVDAVPVVKCKDCKYAKHDTEYLISENLYYCVWHEESHNPNWYCADGEQKDGEKDETD